MKKKGAVFLFLLLTVSSAFYSKGKVKEEGTPTVKLYKSKKYTLLSPDSLEEELSNLYLITITKNTKKKKSISGQLLLEADAQHLSFNLFNEFGLTAISSEFDGKKIEIGGAVSGIKMLKKRIKTQGVFADIQFAFYDVDKLKEALAPLELDFIEHDKDDQNFRILMAKHRCVEMITRQGDKIIIENYIKKYKFVLEELPEDASDNGNIEENSVSELQNE